VQPRVCVRHHLVGALGRRIETDRQVSCLALRERRDRRCAINRTGRREHEFSLPRVVSTGKDALIPITLPVLILGGILGGVFTATEAGAVAALWSILMAAWLYRTLTAKTFVDVLRIAGKRSAMLMFIVATSTLLGWYLTNQRIPQDIAEAILGISDNYWIILLAINAFFLAAGTIVHGTPAILMLVPIFLPLADQLGVDRVHFGLIVTINLGIGQQTPPVASVVLITCAIAKISLAAILPSMSPKFSSCIVVRREYHICMSISRQDRLIAKLADRDDTKAKGPKARMRRTLLAEAMNLMQQGVLPSVSDVAEAAEVSRATAYRYFPSQGAMIQEAVFEALGPILEWTSDSDDAEARVTDLLDTSMPRILQYEATHRGALLLAIDQWAKAQSGENGRADERIARGSRRRLLSDALAPLEETLSPAEFDKLAQALSLIFGVEALVVLRDLWGLNDKQVRDVAIWAARALVRQSIAEADAPQLTKTRASRKKKQAQ